MSSESEDSDSEVMASNSNSEVTPAHVARAALLVARFAAAIQATKKLQNRPRLLEKLVLKCLDTGDAATFLSQKEIFRMMPPPLKEKINRKLSCKWRHPPLVGELMDSLTRHLSLEVEKQCAGEGGMRGWSLQELEQLCDRIAREGRTSLRSLKITCSSRHMEDTQSGIPLAMLSSLLLELRALTSLHIIGLCYLQTRETDHLVSTLASTNPDIRSLQLIRVSYKSLYTIADRWPQLEFLTASRHQFNDSELEAVLPRLRNLKKLHLHSDLSMVMMSVARAHDPASPPYVLEEGFYCDFDQPVSSEDMVKLFTAFPALWWLTLLGRDIPAVCAGLEGREHVHITKLVVLLETDPHALEPLLARVGRHLTKLEVSYKESSQDRVDLNMIGHYCPKLEDVDVTASHLVSGDEFEVTEAFFSKLQNCTLQHNTAQNGPAQLPHELVCSALASPTLEDFDSRGVPITEEVVAALAEQRGRGALSSLKELTVWHSCTSVEALAALVSLAPRLSKLTLGTDDKDDEGLVEIQSVLTSFVQQSELKTSVYVFAAGRYGF